MAKKPQLTQLLESRPDVAELIQKSRDHVLDEKKEHFENAVEQLLEEFGSSDPTGTAGTNLIRKLSKVAKACMNGKWVKVGPEYHRVLQKNESKTRRAELQEPESEETLNQTLMWVSEQGNEEDLEVLARIRDNPPFPSAELKHLAALAEERIAGRLSNPLPEEVARTASFYVTANLGENLVPAARGRASTNKDERTWHVEVRHKTTRTRQGELQIREDGRKVRWVPEKRR
jgi:hypothetical protein